MPYNTCGNCFCNPLSAIAPLIVTWFFNVDYLKIPGNLPVFFRVETGDFFIPEQRKFTTISPEFAVETSSMEWQKIRHSFFNKKAMENTKFVKEGAPADVARDGYKALIAIDDMVVSGFKNKLQVAINNITPHNMLAQQVHKQQQTANANKSINLKISL